MTDQESELELTPSDTPDVRQGVPAFDPADDVEIGGSDIDAIAGSDVEPC